MTKQEQIEEMAKILRNIRVSQGYTSFKCDISCENCPSKQYYCVEYKYAEALYNAGYRKIDDECIVITKAELKQYKVQAVKEFSERLKTEPRITNSGLEFVALVDIDAELEALLKE